jgi:hypothetical protein
MVASVRRTSQAAPALGVVGCRAAVSVPVRRRQRGAQQHGALFRRARRETVIAQQPTGHAAVQFRILAQVERRQVEAEGEHAALEGCTQEHETTVAAARRRDAADDEGAGRPAALRRCRRHPGHRPAKPRGVPA